MHQPFYKDLIQGEYRLPWTRLHALKDYYGMVRMLGKFPHIRQTFNLTPSLAVQIADYAAGTAVDPFFETAMKPAGDLSENEQDFLLRYSFHANPARMILRYPRYGDLYKAWQTAEHNPKRARRWFGTAELQDLQILSQLAWFDEEDLSSDPDIAALVRKERGYDRADQEMIGREQKAALARVLPLYREFAQSGQIELSTSPFYHPILPLICDSAIAAASHPYQPLPGRFRYPEDAREQLSRSRQYMKREFGVEPVGLWPSEGSVSDESLALAAECGFAWAATDVGILSRTLGSEAGPELAYRPYRWEGGGHTINLLFRDRQLSDLLGFVYSRMEVDAAVNHFLTHIHENCRSILARGEDAMVPVILDGENAWEYYDRNGRPFLDALYARLSSDGLIQCLTVAEALERMRPGKIDHIFPGSWINSNFDIWIGHEEDNRAWDCLLRARTAYEQAQDATEEQKRLAYEALLIAEGSDWCWWYGPEHDSANRPEFDRLFRDHLASVYRALDRTPPDDLARPLLLHVEGATHDPPTGLIRPRIDGDVTSDFEWAGAGVFRVDSRLGAMHGQRFLIQKLLYGSDGSSLFLRLDFMDRAADDLRRATLSFRIAPAAHPEQVHTTTLPVEADCAGTVAAIQFAYRKVFEMRVPLDSVGSAPRQPVRIQLSLWQDGLPLDALPQQGWLEVSTAEPSSWGF